jgi:hypothetical protein
VTDELLVLHCKDLIVLATSRVPYSLSIDRGGTNSVPNEVCEPYGGWGGLSDKTSVASESHVVALSLPIFRTKKHFLAEPTTCLTGLQVIGFDLDEKKQIFTLNVSPLPENDYDFAISPDGSKLALLSDRHVSVYAVLVRPHN